MTNLLKAVKSNNLELAAQAIARGEDVNQTDNSGNSLIIVSSADGHAAMVKLLLDNGADIKAVDSGMKATALHASAYLGHPEVMKTLIEYGIDIDAQGPYNGYTALHDAVWQNNVLGVEILVNAGAKTNIKGNNGQTPLDLAKKNHNQQIIAILSAV
jgi:ankyrin repeat protein